MRLKTAYRKSAKEIPATEIPEPNIPEIKIEGEPATVAAVRFESNPEEESPEVATAIKTASDADTSALALKRQIEALRQSEQLCASNRWRWLHNGHRRGKKNSLIGEA